MLRRRRILPTREDLVHGLAVAIVFIAMAAVLILLVPIR
jgi:preprotein translocase subunit SecE